MSARPAPARPLSAEPIRPGVWRVASSRPGEPPYTVHWNGTRGACPCPGYQRWGHCRHLDRVRMLAGRLPAQGRETLVQSPTRALTRVPAPEPLALEPMGTFRPMTVPEALDFCKTMITATGFLPRTIQNVGQLLAIVWTGQELGVGAMASIRHITSVEGKPGLSAELMLALIRRAYGQQTIRIAETTAERATVEWRQAGWEGLQSLTWTIKDAERAGLLKKDNWAKYPAAMLRARAVSAVARMAFPEVALGLEPAVEDPAADAVTVARLIDGGDASVPGHRADGFLSADELQAGGPNTGERGGVVGEILEAECAVCGHRGECLDDGEAYVCRDQGACGTRCLTREEQPAPAPAETPETAGLANAKQLETLRAHLTRTGRAEASLVAEVGALEELTRAEASQLIRELGRVPNATREEVAF